jgi:hypothetical protein
MRRVRSRPLLRPRLGNLLAGTALVLALSVWLVARDVNGDPAALLAGAWTTTALMWGLFGFQALRRRRDRPAGDRAAARE